MATGHSDRLSLLVSMQSQFVDALDSKLGSGAIFGDRQLTNREFLLIILGAYGELAEVVEHLIDATKPWKTVPEDLDDRVFEELIDVLFFVFEAMVFMDKSADDIFDRYMDKWMRNLKRIEESDGSPTLTEA